MGEGAGILVIEELEHAIRRGAKPLAEIVGYGTTADAYHITSGPEDGDGARRAMEGALRQASLRPLTSSISTPIPPRRRLATFRNWKRSKPCSATTEKLP